MDYCAASNYKIHEEGVSARYLFTLIRTTKISEVLIRMISYIKKLVSFRSKGWICLNVVISINSM